LGLSQLDLQGRRAARSGNGQHVEVVAIQTPGSVSGQPSRLISLATWLLLLAYLVTATAYNLAVPVGEAPDEPSHVQYVEILLRTGQLPTIPRDSARYSYEAEQPPLYYIAQAAWMRILWPGDKLLPELQGNPDFSFSSDTVFNAYLHNYPASDAVPVHLMRLLSTLIGLLTLFLIWLSARLIWPDDAGAALVTLGFAGLMPGFTFTSGTVTNDALAATAGAAVLLSVLTMLKRGVGWRMAALAGMALGLGILSKRSLLVLLPVVVLAPLISRGDRRAQLVGAVVALGCAALVGIWPFVGNILNYGDPFATAATMQAKQEIASPLAHMPGFWLAPGYIVGLFNSLWGVFGLRNVELSGAIYAFYYGLCLFALVAWIYRLPRGDSGDRRVMLVLGAVVLLVYAGVAYQNTQFWAVQGRLLLPGFAALSLLVGRGLSLMGARFFSTYRARAVALGLLLALLLALNWYALVAYLLPAYYRG
jgi:4-amino-4-deoxy-L-arabinose transferase-like glycosyltransferase